MRKSIDRTPFHKVSLYECIYQFVIHYCAESQERICFEKIRQKIVKKNA